MDGWNGGMDGGKEAEAGVDAAAVLYARARARRDLGDSDTDTRRAGRGWTGGVSGVARVGHVI
jgi:hypothetical protein